MPPVFALRQRWLRTRTVGALASGAALLGTGHAMTRVHWQPWCEYWYALVWLGFILTAEGLLDGATGHCLLFDRPRELGRMFAVSAVLWWLVEILNAIFFGGWRYSSSPQVAPWIQYVRSTVFFSTLIPATWEALMLGARALRVRSEPLRADVDRRFAVAALLVGVGLLVVLGAGQLRDFRLPIGLLAALLLLDAANALTRRPSLLRRCASGRDRARFLASVVLSNLALGLLSEMWNHTATPKWTYDAPYAGAARLFGMPLLGYVGYVVLALIVYAAYHLVRARSHGKSDVDDLPADHPAIVLGLR